MPSTRRNLTLTLALGGMALCASSLAAEGNGLQATTGTDLWPRWHARVLTSNSFSLWRHAASGYQDNARLQQQDSLSLLGDYYFLDQAAQTPVSGGFRATSGLILGPLGSHVLSAFSSGSRPGFGAGIARAGAFDTRSFSTNLATSTYVGLGYTSLQPKSGWGFSADIGIVASNPGSANQFGQSVGGAQPLDEMLRDMRLSPLLNIGVSYSF